jgi:ribosomal protein S18 acetylase RimI-like enzyme
VLYRLYNPPDFTALYAIEVVCFQPSMRFGRRFMRQLIESSSARTWIAEQGGVMAGFTIVEWTEERAEVVAYIQTIEVLPEQRGRGVGGELLLRAEDTVRAAGAGTLWLHVDAGNAGAIRLYEAHGYHCEGREEDFYASNRAALVYRKLLVEEKAV